MSEPFEEMLEGLSKVYFTNISIAAIAYSQGYASDVLVEGRAPDICLEIWAFWVESWNLYVIFYVLGQGVLMCGEKERVC